MCANTTILLCNKYHFAPYLYLTTNQLGIAYVRLPRNLAPRRETDTTKGPRSTFPTFKMRGEFAGT